MLSGTSVRTKAENFPKEPCRGTTVTCPRHKAQFDVKTGGVVTSPKILFMHPKINNAPIYAVKVEGTAILIEHE